MPIDENKNAKIALLSQGSGPLKLYKVKFNLKEFFTMKMVRKNKVLKSALFLKSLLLTAVLISTSAEAAEAPKPSAFEQSKPLKIALTNFKTCVEKSKLGQKEQSAFDGMKKQMETILMEKEKALREVATKFNDMDYLDSLSQQAEAELKQQYRSLNQEFNQQQSQFYQTLSQTNMAIVQKLTEEVTSASQKVAKDNGIDIVLNEESAFYTSPAIDISTLVVKVMDENFAKEEGSTREGEAKKPEPVKPAPVAQPKK